MNNKQIYYKGHEDFISRIDDYLYQVHQYGKVFTPFLTPLEQHILLSYVGKKAIVQLDGGYLNSENKRAMISSDSLTIPLPITCLKANYNEDYHSLSHRDVLGAIMNLGIQRNQFGDMIVESGNIYIFCTKEISPFLIQELSKIQRVNVTFEEYDEPITYEPILAYTTKHVSSFRLDALVAAITNESREKAKKIIYSGLVKVDHLPLEECDYLCNNNCILSIRGYGRYKVIDLERTTRSKRYCVSIGKYE